MRNLTKVRFLVAVVGVILLLFCTNTYANAENPFEDVEDDNPNAIYIFDLYHKGIIDGLNEHTYAPGDPLTREQFARLVVDAFQIESNEDIPPFRDLVSEWSKPYISAAYSAGVIHGVSEDEFNPTGHLKRQEAAAIVWRILEQQRVQSVEFEKYDASDADEWAKESVRNIMALGLRTERFSTEPYRSQEMMTRGDVAPLISLAIQETQHGYKRTREDVIVYDQNVIVIEDSSAVTKRDDDIFEISDLQGVEEDQIIIIPPTSEHPLGLAKKVVSIDEENQVLLVKTEDPTFDEVVDKIQVFEEIRLNSENTIIMEYDTVNDVSVLSEDQKDGTSDRSKPKANIEFENDALKFKFQNFNFMEAQLDGEVMLEDPSVLFDLDYDNSTINDYTFSFTAGHHSELDVSYSAEIPQKIQKSIGKIVVPIPKTPLGIILDIQLIVEMDGTISLTYSQSGDLKMYVSPEEKSGQITLNPEYGGIELALNGSMSLDNHMFPSLFQLKLSFMSIEQSVVGIRAAIEARHLGVGERCGKLDLFIFSDSHAQINIKALDSQFQLYNFEKNLYSIDDCEANDAESKDEEPGNNESSSDTRAGGWDFEEVDTVDYRPFNIEELQSSVNIEGFEIELVQAGSAQDFIYEDGSGFDFSQGNYLDGLPSRFFIFKFKVTNQKTEEDYFFPNIQLLIANERMGYPHEYVIEGTHYIYEEDLYVALSDVYDTENYWPRGTLPYLINEKFEPNETKEGFIVFYFFNDQIPPYILGEEDWDTGEITPLWHVTEVE